MKEILEFLNEQSGLRLFGYGVLLIIVVGIIFDNLSKIVESISNTIKNRYKKEK